MFQDEDDQSHPCSRTGCKNIVPFDDEPYCYDCSPDSGSNVPGFSYKKLHPVA